MAKAKRDGDGVSRRKCRACGKTFTYPEVKSAATRVHCGSCALLPKPVRLTFEQLTRRVNLLEKQLKQPAAKAKAADAE